MHAMFKSIALDKQEVTPFCTYEYQRGNRTKEPNQNVEIIVHTHSRNALATSQSKVSRLTSTIAAPPTRVLATNQAHREVNTSTA